MSMRIMNLKKLVLTSFCLLFAGAFVQAQVPGIPWAAGIGGTSDDEVQAVASDGSGNVYVTGKFSTDITVSGNTLVAQSLGDLFIAKYDGSGAFQWIKHAYSTDPFGTMDGFDMVVDGNGNLILAGTQYKDAVIDGDTVSGPGDVNVFVAKWDNSGSLTATTTFGKPTGIFSNIAHGVAVDNSNNIYLTGVFTEDVAFDGITLYSMLSESIFILQMNNNLQVQWAVEAGDTTAFSRGRGIDWHGGNVYVGGTFDSRATFGSANELSQGGNDAFIASYTDGGNFNWVESGGGLNDDQGLDADVDENGGVYVCGYFSTSANFNGTTVNSPGLNNSFIAKYNSGGTFSFVEDPRSKGPNASGQAVRMDASNTVAIAGVFQDSLVFQNFGLYTGPGGMLGGYVADLDFNGSDYWASKKGIEMRAVAKGPSGETFAGGGFVDPETFGSTSLTANGAKDAVFMEFAPTIASIENPNQDLAGISVFPNPMQRNATVAVELKSAQEVSVKVTDLQGRVVKNLHQGFLTAGIHNLNLDANDLQAGMYFVVLTNGEEKIILRAAKMN